MVEGEEGDVLVRPERREGGPEERPGAQVERPPRLFPGQAAELGLPFGRGERSEVEPRQLDRARRADDLDRPHFPAAARGRGEGGAQRLVPLDEPGEAPGEGRRIEPAVKAHGERHQVGDAAGFELL